MKLILLSTLMFLLLPIEPSIAKSVVYQVDGQEYEGFIINKGKRAPTIIIVHDWDGLTDYEIKRAEMFGKLGYSVFAIDLFGKGVRPTEDKDKKQHTGELYGDRAKMRRLLNGALDEARKGGLNTNNAIEVGYCFGGAAVLEHARSGIDLKAFVSFHGGLETPVGQDYITTKGSVLVFHGTADTAISMDQFAGLAKELEKTKVPHEMVTYGGAPHAFSVFGSERYQKEADTKSWARLLSFLKVTTGK